jgi:hypothetical protein
MDLFTSYISPTNAAIAYCDLTEFTCRIEPQVRLLCNSIETRCGTEDCSTLMVNNGIGLCDCSDTWNANCCGNDTPFLIPFQEGDTIDFQFQQNLNSALSGVPDGWVSAGTLATRAGAAYFEIRTCCDDTLIEVDDSAWDAIVKECYVGSFETILFDASVQSTPVQMIRFDLFEILDLIKQSGISEQCFYFKFCFTKNSAKIQNPINPANVDCFCSESFQYEKCLQKEKRSVLISSLYSNTDCFGYYYGNQFVDTLGGSPFVYSNEIRVPAVFEQINFEVNKSIINSSRKTTSTEICENWALRSFALPLRYMKLIVNVIAGKDLFVDGREFNFQGEVSKNNETGTRWFMEINLQRCECSKNLTC